MWLLTSLDKLPSLKKRKCVFPPNGAFLDSNYRENIVIEDLFVKLYFLP
jgi:hypothetical protein